MGEENPGTNLQSNSHPKRLIREKLKTETVVGVTRREDEIKRGIEKWGVLAET